MGYPHQALRRLRGDAAPDGPAGGGRAREHQGRGGSIGRHLPRPPGADAGIGAVTRCLRCPRRRAPAGAGRRPPGRAGAARPRTASAPATHSRRPWRTTKRRSIRRRRKSGRNLRRWPLTGGRTARSTAKRAAWRSPETPPAQPHYAGSAAPAPRAPRRGGGTPVCHPSAGGGGADASSEATARWGLGATVAIVLLALAISVVVGYRISRGRRAATQVADAAVAWLTATSTNGSTCALRTSWGRWPRPSERWSATRPPWRRRTPSPAVT